MQVKLPRKWVNREISWLQFNHRVLQEAEDKRNPLIERMKFLGIFSNNRDEFFKVRVATVKRLMEIGGDAKNSMGEDPFKIMESIQKMVLKQQNKFDSIYNSLLKDLQKEDIYFLDEKQISGEHIEFVKRYFKEQVQSALSPILIDKKGDFPFLKDAASYLFVTLRQKASRKVDYAVIEIPTDEIPRIVELPSIWKKKFLMISDDLIRYNLPEVFSYFKYDSIEAWTIKMTRDAELDLDEDVSKSLVDKLSKSIKNRKVGDPVRFVYDKTMPVEVLNFIKRKLKLVKKDSIIPGGRYHNFKDFIDFPNIGARKLRNPSLPALVHPDFRESDNVLDVVSKKDVLLFYPFQKFDYVIDFVRQSALDPNVTTIKINLYRVAKNSKIIKALVNAVQNGKDVTVLVELRARFDERNNIMWSNKLQEQGVKVVFGVPGLKVHSKLIYIERKVGRATQKFAHVGTGNFNEKTAHIYSDISLLTSDQRISGEVEKVFEFIERPYLQKRFNHLVLSPFNTRNKFTKLIDREIRNANKGREAWIRIKLNNLNDPALIKKLYEASCEGVKINLIIRGICSLVPGIKDLSENIEVTSIVDRFLEHARIFAFCNNGKEEYYMGSADWLVRNIDRRVEVTTPIYDPELVEHMRTFMNLQLKDNVKARILNDKGTNKYVKPTGPEHRSQIETYDYFKSLLD